MTDARRMAFREWFGLRPAEADLLIALYDAGGKPSSAFKLGQGAKLTTGSISVHVCSIRSALEAEALDSQPMQGYWLTETGLAECRAAIWQMGEELRSAS